MTRGETSGAETSAYKPYTSARRPGGPPESRPGFRILVHRKHEARWNELVDRVGLEQAQRFYDHVCQTPGAPAEGIRVTPLRGRAGRPQEPGFSQTLHWRVPGRAARIDYQYNAAYRGGRKGDPHPVVRIIAINFSSH
ncbi:MAG: hypothetical protein ACRDLY_06300 [Thermoleophilaceae bacterium]